MTPDDLAKPFTKEELFDFSHFDINGVLRGAQLTLVGAQRALQNPGLWTTQHYRQAAIAVGCGIAIRILIEIPILLVKLSLWILSFFLELDAVTWDDSLTEGLRFLQEYVLQVPLFVMTLLRHLTPAMDELFMLSLQWVDYTYTKKHEHEGPIDPRLRYYDNLRAYADGRKAHGSGKNSSGSGSGSGKSGLMRFLTRFARKTFLSLAIFALSYLPLVGRFVLPAVSFVTFRTAVGLGPAAVIFGTGLFLPRRYLIVFLQTYYGSRRVMRELLGPYFSRVRFSSAQKRSWFHSREGLLFGFGAGFYMLLRVPLVGVLIYGIAEASTAYLVTKITDPPPASTATAADVAALEAYAESQQQWKQKKAFLNLALDNLDALQQQHRTPMVYAPQDASDEVMPGGYVHVNKPAQQQQQQQQAAAGSSTGYQASPRRDEPPPPYTPMAGQ